MAALCSRCRHYIFVLFRLVLSFFPRLISAVADVYHTSTHGVALVRIWNAGWNVLRAARLKCSTQKIAKNSPKIRQKFAICRGHHRTNLSGCVFATNAHIDNQKKLVKQQCLPHTSSQYGELRPTSGWVCWDLLASLGHPCKFQQVSHFSSITARHSSSGHKPNFAALNRWRYLDSAVIMLGIGPHF